MDSRPHPLRALTAPGPETLFRTGVGLAAWLCAWVFSSPGQVPLINWDTASYLSRIASGQYGWSAIPWNTHLGVGQVYLFGVALAELLGLSATDGTRIVGAIAFTILTLVIADTLRIVTRNTAVALALTAAWATAWVNFHFHLIIEDNFFHLAPAAVILRLCVLHAERWRARDSVLAGAMVTIGFLGSWQALPYLAPPIWAALIGGERRTALVRARDALLVPAAYLAALLTWAALTAAATGLELAPLLKIVFSKAEPSFFPKSVAEVIDIFRTGTAFDTVGTGVAYHVTFQAYALKVKPALSFMTLGVLAFVFQTVLFVAGTWYALRTRRPALHILTGMLLLFTVVTSLHKDEAHYAELKRFDYVPLFLAYIAGLAYAAAGPRLGRNGARVLAVAVAALALVQLGLGLRWARRELASYRTTAPWTQLPHPPHQVYGRDGRSWFGYFRALRRDNPAACRFVFVSTELNSGFWNFDVVGTLYAELPDHLVLEDPSLPMDRPLAVWRDPVKRATVDEARRRGLLDDCAWLSPEAKTLVAGR